MAGLLLFANNATTTLAGSISSGATSCNLAAGTGALFPSPTGGQYFMMTFNDAATGLVYEIVKVTARSGDTLTIARGQEGTTPRSWLNGDTAANWWTAGSATAMVQQSELQQEPGNYAQDTGSTNAIVVTLSPVPPSLAYLTGSPIRIKVANTNSGSTTLKVNTLAATNVISNNTVGPTLLGGELLANGIYTFVFDGVQFQVIDSPTSILQRTNTWTKSQTFNANANFGANVVVTGDVHSSTLGVTNSVGVGGQVAADNFSGNFATLSFGAIGSGNIARVVRLGDFSLSSTGDGWWLRLPNGMYLQGGAHNPTNAIFNYPVAFPSGIMFMVVGNIDSQGANADVAFGYPISNSQFYLATKISQSPSGISNFGVSWIALGL